MLSLPLELIRQIIEDIVDDDLIHYNDLSMLSLSCRVLRHEAQRVLFRHPELETESYSKTVMFLDTISSSPDRIALYVWDLEIIFNGWFHQDPDATIQFLLKLSSALQAMYSLKSLNVVSGIHSVPFLASVLERVHFKLTSFCWSGCADDVSDAARIKNNFLQHQDEIEHLSISAFIDKCTLQPIAADVCPRLRSLSAPYAIMELVLPNKKYVTSLQWILPHGEGSVSEDFDMDNPFRLNLVSNELANIRYLSYADCSDGLLPTAPLLQDVAQYMKSLVRLQTDRGDIKVEKLAQFPHLKILVLTASTYGDFPEHDEVTPVAAACKFLECIDIEDDEGLFSSYQCDHSTKPCQVYVVDLDESCRILWDEHFHIFDL